MTLLPLLLFSIAVIHTQNPVSPLIHAHAHNDYEHKRPLFDALDQGFGSVEADIYLVDGKLLVAHDLKDVKPEKTLQSLYLDPLAQKVKENGGRVFRNGPVESLLIDVKSDADTTYAALAGALRPYEAILTHFRPGKTDERAITVIISGNRAKEKMLAEKERLAGYDGRPEDLDGPLDGHFMPWISESWRALFKWRGVGPFPEDERAKLRDYIGKAHRKGVRVRFWATNELPALWRELLDAGADLINTDDLKSLRKYLLESGADGKSPPGGLAP